MEYTIIAWQLIISHIEIWSIASIITLLHTCKNILWKCIVIVEIDVKSYRYRPEWYGQTTYRVLVLFILYALHTLSLSRWENLCFCVRAFHFWNWAKWKQIGNVMKKKREKKKINRQPNEQAYVHCNRIIPFLKVCLSFILFNSWFIWNCVSVSLILTFLCVFLFLDCVSPCFFVCLFYFRNIYFFVVFFWCFVYGLNLLTMFQNCLLHCIWFFFNFEIILTLNWMFFVLLAELSGWLNCDGVYMICIYCRTSNYDRIEIYLGK